MGGNIKTRTMNPPSINVSAARAEERKRRETDSKTAVEEDELGRDG